MLAPLLLDLGNVVLELDFPEMVKQLGLELPSADAMIEMDRLEAFDAFERGTLGEADFLALLNGRLPEPLAADVFRAAWNSIFVGEIAGVAALLARWSTERPLFALTNVNPIHMKRALEYPALTHFHRIFTSYELGHRKPEPKSFLSVCEATGHAPGDFLFVDDRPENVEGARRIGMRAEQVFRSADALERAVKGRER